MTKSEYKQTYFKKLKDDPIRYEKYLADNRKRAKAYRASIKGTPKEEIEKEKKRAYNKEYYKKRKLEGVKIWE